MAESFTCASIKVVARGESGGKDSLEASLMDPTLGCTLHGGKGTRVHGRLPIIWCFENSSEL